MWPPVKTGSPHVPKIFKGTSRRFYMTALHRLQTLTPRLSMARRK